MSSTQTFYYKPKDDYKPYAFFDDILKKWVYFSQQDRIRWGHNGKGLLALHYPLKSSHTPELNDNEYTGYYYYEIVFKPGSNNINNHSTMGSA